MITALFLENQNVGDLNIILVESASNISADLILINQPK